MANGLNLGGKTWRGRNRKGFGITSVASLIWESCFYEPFVPSKHRPSETMESFPTRKGDAYHLWWNIFSQFSQRFRIHPPGKLSPPGSWQQGGGGYGNLSGVLSRRSCHPRSFQGIVSGRSCQVTKPPPPWVGGGLFEIGCIKYEWCGVPKPSTQVPWATPLLTGVRSGHPAPWGPPAYRYHPPESPPPMSVRQGPAILPGFMCVTSGRWRLTQRELFSFWVHSYVFSHIFHYGGL